MDILFISTAIFFFFVGFVYGGGWQRERSEKEIQRLKKTYHDIPTVAYSDSTGLKIYHTLVDDGNGNMVDSLDHAGNEELNPENKIND